MQCAMYTTRVHEMSSRKQRALSVSTLGVVLALAVVSDHAAAFVSHSGIVPSGSASVASNRAAVAVGAWRGTAAGQSSAAVPAGESQYVGKGRRPGFQLGCASTMEPPTASASSGTPSAPVFVKPLELWLDARGADAEDDGTDWKKFQELADVVLCDEFTSGDFGAPPKRRLLVDDDGKLVNDKGDAIGASLAVTGARSQGKALALVGSVDWIQVTCSDWTMIPAENLVSTAGGTPTRIALELSEPAQVQGAAFALQIGVDALLLAPDKDLWAAAVSAREQRNHDPTEKVSPTASAAKPAAVNGEASSSSSGGGGGKGEESSTALKASSGGADEKSASGGSGGAGKTGGEGAGGSVAGGLTVARVTKTVEGGVGDRVCVDLIQSLKAGEGMLVGSSAKMLALVHAEVYDTGFMPARPFRINAGPVHSYALLADGSIKYLTELCAGDQVLVSNWKGETRKVSIGRLKVETRPMIMVEFQVESGGKGQLFLQQAETVRFVSPTTSTGGKVEDWQPLSVTDVEGGEALLVREITRGTHMGKAIDASVTET
ncbi:unnamed protein product [Scytosiphon promiscuus]